MANMDLLNMGIISRDEARKALSGYWYSAGIPMTATTANTSTPVKLSRIVGEIVTILKPDEKVVVCVDLELSEDQCFEVAEALVANKIPALVIRGARAGTGFPSDPGRVKTSQEKRVDILARIGEIWARQPDLRLSELLGWFTELNIVEAIDDEDFATATETYFMKVTDGVHSRPQ